MAKLNSLNKYNHRPTYLDVFLKTPIWDLASKRPTIPRPWMMAKNIAIIFNQSRQSLGESLVKIINTDGLKRFLIDGEELDIRQSTPA